MFEKEAEEYAKQSCFTEMQNPSLSESIDISDDIKDAVMFGYNKGKEELEKENAELKARLNAVNLLTPELEKQLKHF